MVDKAEALHTAGIDALMSGQIGTFPGFDREELIRRCVVAGLPTTPSQWTFSEGVRRLLAVTSGLGLPLYAAGRDFPWHVTMLEGRDESSPYIPLQAPIIDGARNFAGRWHSSIEIFLSRLVLDVRGNIILTADWLPESVHIMREELAKLYQHQNLKPLAMENILHCTVARLTAVPGPAERHILREYLQFWRVAISHSPIEMPISQLVGTRSDVFFFGLFGARLVKA
ncbi:MAG: hypothetical protein AAB817_01065 [Patescibacteria group bacterium]